MKSNIKTLAITLIVICVLIYENDLIFAKNWQLGLYGNGKTLMRSDYKSKETCMSAGKSYYRDGNTQYERFDCGYKCKYYGDRNNLENGGVCKTVCDNYGCK